MAISSQRLTIYLYSGHRAVIFAIAQLSCLDMWWCGISSFLRSANRILFTLLLIYLIPAARAHRSHHLHSHHLSLPRPFTPYLRLISFINPFLHSHSDSFRTAFTDIEPVLNLVNTGVFKICFSVFFNIFSATCARLSWTHSAFESTINSTIVFYMVKHLAIVSPDLCLNV